METKSTLELQELVAQAGERIGQHITIQVANVPLTLPVFLINGVQPGPTLVLTAGIHGAEYPCVEAALRLGQRLAPEELRGQMLIVPSANPTAFAARSIYVTPQDGKNLNRQFPGSAQGTFSQALAYWLFTEVIQRGDYYIDLHGGDMIEALLPFASVAVTGNTAVDQQSEALAQSFGLPYIALPSDPSSGIDGATHIEAAVAGIPALLAEAGGQGILDEASVQILEMGVRRVMAHLDMLEPLAPLAEKPVRMTQWSWLRATVDGLYYPTTEVGATVNRGQPVGRIADAFGKTLQTMNAPQDGVVLFLVTSLAINEGDPLLAIAQ